MSQIVFGAGTSHSPLLALEPEMWVERARDDVRFTELQLEDGRIVDYAGLAEASGNRHAPVATLENFREQWSRANAALDRLAGDIANARLDLLVIIGDDQDELFKLEHMPALAIYYGDKVVMHPRGGDMPAWRKLASRGYGMDDAHEFAAAPQYARGLIEGLLERGVDIGSAAQVTDPVRAGFGHAFGFVHTRLLGQNQIPVVPVMLNTYFPPNVLRPWRCYDVGRILREVIEAMPDDLRVGVIASGGLSHFATDETLDRRVLDALRTGDAEPLRTLEPHRMRSGSSEILNWVMAGGVLEGLPNQWLEYIPVYRTPAGTGVGLGFTAWYP